MPAALSSRENCTDDRRKPLAGATGVHFVGEVSISMIGKAESNEAMASRHRLNHRLRFHTSAHMQHDRPFPIRADLINDWRRFASPTTPMISMNGVGKLARRGRVEPFSDGIDSPLPAKTA
jgi:hypothetical protein